MKRYRCKRCGHEGVASSDVSMGPDATFLQRDNEKPRCRVEHKDGHGLCNGVGVEIKEEA